MHDSALAWVRGLVEWLVMWSRLLYERSSSLQQSPYARLAFSRRCHLGSSSCSHPASWREDEAWRFRRPHQICHRGGWACCYLTPWSAATPPQTRCQRCHPPWMVDCPWVRRSAERAAQGWRSHFGAVGGSALHRWHRSRRHRHQRCCDELLPLCQPTVKIANA